MNIIRKNSPNHYNGRNGWKADVIVFHQTGGTSATPALNWYMNKNAQCSPHFVIDTNGDIYQLVDLDNGAWCNGTNTTPGHKLFYGNALSELVRVRKTNANYYTYSIEFVHCQWGNINPAQVTAAVELIQNVIFPHMKKCGVTPVADRKHFIGHSDVAPVARPNGSCPGKNFPYDEIIAKVGGKVQAPVTASAKIRKCTVLYHANIREIPALSGKLLGKYKPGDTVTVLAGVTAEDPVSGNCYIRVAGEREAWILAGVVR